MKIEFFDAHTHANLAAFKDDYKEVVSRALKAGVGMINVGTQKDTSLRAVEIAHEFPNEPVFATVGLHPTHAHENDFHDAQELTASAGVPETFDYDFYRRLALDPKVVGIGECGLDYAAFDRKRSERLQKRALATPTESGSEFPQEKIEIMKEKQKAAFLEQIKLAREVKKPLMIHCRSAFPELVKILEENVGLLNDNPGIIHFMSGTKDEAKKLLDLGFYFTFGGVITFIRDYDEVLRMIPMDRVLSETDAPYVAPAPYRGKRNEPAYVIEVVRKLAELKGLSTEEMGGRILKNVSECFNLKLI